MASKKKHASDFHQKPTTQHPDFQVPQVGPLYAYPPDAIAAYQYTIGTM